MKFREIIKSKWIYLSVGGEATHFYLEVGRLEVTLTKLPL